MISSPGCCAAAAQHARREVDADLNGLAPGGAEIVPLEIGALDSLAAPAMREA